MRLLAPVIVLLFLAPAAVHASVVINEVAWPNTSLAVVLAGFISFLVWFLRRTKGQQGWCLGKMGIMLLLSVPGYSHAAIVINEIAWMGTETSANDEWIELYNSGSAAVDLDGWLLEDGMNLSIALTGTIAAGRFAVLERTDDSSAPGSAFMVYTGALANTGATLTLKDVNGSIQDVVSGGEDWESIGGDNVTKETAQLTTAGWITAPATPGARNATIDSRINDDDEEEDDDTKEKDSKSSGTVKSTNGNKQARELTLPGSLLSLQIDVSEVVYINQPVVFEALPSGLGHTLTESLSYRWNFGDMSTGKGKTISHTYAYPGEYVVTVWAGYKRQEQIARHTITVLPVKFSLTKNLSGDIQIHNDSPYEVDVSGFTLVGGTAPVTFPPLSFISERGTVTIPKEKLGDVRHLAQIQLHDQTGTLQAGYAPSRLAAVVEPAPVVKAVAAEVTEAYSLPVAANEVTDSAFTFGTLIAQEAQAAQAASTTETNILEDTAVPAGDRVANEQQPNTNDDWTLLGLAAIVLLGVFGVYAGTQKGDKEG